jgi:hypothetical protein
MGHVAAEYEGIPNIPVVNICCMKKPRPSIARKTGLLPQPIRNLAKLKLPAGGYPTLKKLGRFQGKNSCGIDR